ncbi:unnamed protein product [Vitrella brassicaformis CCMP3155]|uniref:Uncharacterized protein n=1 Tax=Vitrella brassicaformis (strain CCMP3155) TaxID=1169540 RepID=A0A0G4EVG4_VITBC|nr:unnamed protein product [Vitrella brassicaformis CCMP3155]|eukprot:CEM02621.1 unnamed protein product [Vitrella brassicaformis CCMP3155]
MNGHHDALSDDAQSLSSAYTVAAADVMQQLQSLQRSQEALAAQHTRQMEQTEARHQAAIEKLESRIRGLEALAGIAVGSMSFEGGVYDGQLMGRKPHGSGILRAQHGRVIYTGDWRHGKRHGRGKSTNGRMVYEGQWADGEMKGKGHITNLTLKDAQGQHLGLFTGPTLDAKPHGEGDMRDDLDQVIYKGEWIDGVKKGAGEATGMPWEEGCKYYGGTFHGQPDGEGELRDGDDQPIYKGEWKNGKRHGQGKAYYRDRRTQGWRRKRWRPVLWFDGEWRKGKVYRGILFPNGGWVDPSEETVWPDPRHCSLPISWQAGQEIPHAYLPGIGYLSQWLANQDVSVYLPDRLRPLAY